MALFMMSCGNDKDSIREEARTTISVPANPPVPVSTPTVGGAVAGVQHYTCPNNCAGSGGAAQGTCPVCGTAYEHNQAYHAQPPQVGGVTTPSSPSATPTFTPPAVTAPAAAQNAAGVYHYTCGDGCAGGAASAGNCATCGKALAHNQAYHN